MHIEQCFLHKLHRVSSVVDAVDHPPTAYPLPLSSPHVCDGQLLREVHQQFLTVAVRPLLGATLARGSALLCSRSIR